MLPQTVDSPAKFLIAAIHEHSGERVGEFLSPHYLFQELSGGVFAHSPQVNDGVRVVCQHLNTASEKSPMKVTRHGGNNCECLLNIKTRGVHDAGNSMSIQRSHGSASKKNLRMRIIMSARCPGASVCARGVDSAEDGVGLPTCMLVDHEHRKTESAIKVLHAKKAHAFPQDLLYNQASPEHHQHQVHPQQWYGRREPTTATTETTTRTKHREPAVSPEIPQRWHLIDSRPHSHSLMPPTNCRSCCSCFFYF